MKTVLTLVVAVMMTSSMLAQAPNKMSYQAVIRNSSNALVANKVVGIKISILQTSSTGTAVFVETHTPQTNANGLATLEIGGGSVVSGSFTGIDWSKGPYFITTETDPTGGTNYTISGVSQILSVPYALQSATANALSSSATGVVRALNGKSGNLFLKGAGGTTINNSGDTISISSSGGSGGTGIQGVQSTDGIVRISNPNGPIATLNINDGSIPAEKLAAGVIPTSAGGDLSGTYLNPLVVKLQGRPITNTLPTSGQSLAWNGTAWAPSTVSSGWSLTGNTGVNPLVNFLGTKDSMPLIINTFNSERMRISTTGNVGIGTISPVARLEIKEIEEGSAIPSVRIYQHNCGPACAQTPGIALQIVNNNNTGIDNGARISFADSINVFKSDEGAASIHLINRVSAKGYGGLAFSTRNFQGFGERMRIDSSGRVGIGTSTPGKTLDVNGITRISDHLIFNNINGVINWGTADLYFRTNSTVGNEQNYSDKMIIKNNGNVGIGTTAPATKLHVSTSTTGYVSTFEGATGADQATINLKYGGKNGYISHGGWNLGVDILGFGGQNHAYPDLMINTNTGNVGVGTNAPNSRLHVNGSTILSNTQDASQGNTGVGVAPYSNVKLAVKSNQTFGVSIDAPTTPSGYALYVVGSAGITGTLSKGGGSFKIDHPLDPANKYLYHSFVESPDMMNIYNGNITTDDQGIATVTLPDYFEALNKDFRYQLTVIGTFAQAIILQKVKGNSFVIKTDKPNVEVSWQVTGIRQDAFANKNRIPNSVDKAEKERGLYLHPDAFGLPESANVKNVQLEAPVK